MPTTLKGRLSGLLLAGFVLGACGVPQEQHDAVLKDLEQTQNLLAETQNNLDKVTSDRNVLKNQLETVAGDKDALARRLGATQQELADLRRARAAAEERSKTFRQLLERLKSMIDSGQLNVKIRKGRMIVQMSDKILFDPAKIKLKDDGRQALTELAGVLKEINDRDFLVAGHTDNVPIRTRRFRSNWELSAARAVEVVKFLEEQGVDPKHLAAAGYAANDPVGDNETEEGRKSNRRIEIVLMPKLSELPGMEQ